MAWGKAGSTTLSSAGDDLDITSMTASKFNQFMIHTLRTGTGVSHNKRWLTTLDNNTATDYCWRRSVNGVSEATTVTQTSIDFCDATEDESEEFGVIYGLNIDGEEKLFIMPQRVYAFQAGAGNGVGRAEIVAKCDTTTNTAQYTRIDVHNDNAGSYETDSNLSALGSDLTPAAAVSFPTDVQVGSRAEITDSRKMYYFGDVTGSDVSLTGLKAYYNFDQTSGNLINKAESSGSTDSLGTATDGTNSNVSQTNTGILGNSYLYNKTSSYTQLGSSLSQFNFCHTPNFKWTFNAWYKMTTDPTSGSHQKMFSDYATSGYRTGVDLAFNNLTVSGTVQSVSTGSIITGSTGNILPADTDWHMITWRFDHTLSSANAKIRIDNGSDSTLNKTASTPSSGNHQHEGHIGSTGIENYNFGGLLDEISIWDRVLTDAELTALYNTGAGKRIGDSWKELGT